MKTERAIRQAVLGPGFWELKRSEMEITKPNMLVMATHGEFREFHFGDGLERLLDGEFAQCSNQ
jgi:hypothetical protein